MAEYDIIKQSIKDYIEDIRKMCGANESYLELEATIDDVASMLNSKLSTRNYLEYLIRKGKK